MVPDDFPKNEELMFEVELIDFFPVKVISYSDLVRDLEIKSLCFFTFFCPRKRRFHIFPFLLHYVQLKGQGVNCKTDITVSDIPGCY